MRKAKQLLLLTTTFTLHLTFAQVGINTNSPNATLDVRSATTDFEKPDGIIAPILSDEILISKDNAYDSNQKGALVYVDFITPGMSRSAKTILVNQIGYYYFDGQVWQRLVTSNAAPNWFYMPSFNLDMSQLGIKQVNLYDEYLRQFTKNPSQGFFSSNSDSEFVTQIYEADELEYIVSFYDSNYILIDEISEMGIMKYQVMDINPPLHSFINIILKPKTN
jgi:hypothetical protein